MPLGAPEETLPPTGGAGGGGHCWSSNTVNVFSAVSWALTWGTLALGVVTGKLDGVCDEFPGD